MGHYTIKYVLIASVLLISTLVAGCLNFTVYGPYDDFSDLQNDFISESIKKNLRIGQPYGNKRMIRDAYTHFSSINFDLKLIEKHMKAGNAMCRYNKDELTCEATRTWTVIWPKPTTGFDGGFQVDKIQQINLHIYYFFKKIGSDETSIDIKLNYL